MPDSRHFDLKFRPQSYWGPQEIQTYFEARIKGELRRQAAKTVPENETLDPEIFSESLSDESRTSAGAIHPWLMGGEYLPDLYPNEVEIARVTMKSTTMDVISIRARRTKHRIIYRIVDEYPKSGIDFTKIRKTSIKPLTLGQLISLMDSAPEGGLVGGGREFNYRECGVPEEVYDFETASSAYYPQLSEWYDIANEEWLDNELGSTREEREREQLESEYLTRFLDGEEYTSADEKKWRDQNQQYLTEHLHIKYQSRYMDQKPAESQDEIDWRKCNEQELRGELEFTQAVQSCVKSALELIVRSGTAGRGGAWGAGILTGKVRRYVEQYLRTNGRVPEGNHIADGVKVTFPANDRAPE
ncbi:hypothetical protein ACFL3W_01325 [Pseudomonadota bacterium]